MSRTRRSVFVLAWLGGASLFAQTTGSSRNCCPVTPESIVWARFATQAKAALRANRNAIPPLPPAPEGITDLRFDEFFKPIGDRGPEYTEKIRSLNGRRVRVAGFMVNQQVQTPGMLLLTSAPVVTHEIEYGLCDELPPATLHVVMATPTPEKIRLTAGPLVLTGTLEVGPHTEADGRNSVARLIVDAASDGQPQLISAYALYATTAP